MSFRRTPPARNGCTILCCFKVTSDDYLPIYEPEQDYGSQEISGNKIVQTSTDSGYLEGFRLSEIPEDLEELLIKKLDVRRNGERLNGWQKIGTGFGIGRDDLKYLENAYKKDGGSPTKELLEKLSTRGKSVSDLVNVLKSPNVNYPDVALLIEKRVGIH